MTKQNIFSWAQTWDMTPGQFHEAELSASGSQHSVHKLYLFMLE